MLRNFLVAGIVSSLMGAFVLSFQALTPKDTLPKMQSKVDKDAAEEPNGMKENSDPQPMKIKKPATGDNQKQAPMKSQQPGPANGKMADNSGQKKQDMANGQMQSPGMGMCGRMMKMMMGGKMN